ncbi:hypothetical protein [Burkholderia sp. Ac-20365]|uniref:hypothetical protein n=1 Tax=Burkholderia sp. Ac-20365 TaxID=2703897 RepID=UPI00197C3B59|nr:hypothetical protein [Burkholderia sp. Ac-20365]MBN3761106.1 hypothetical protein [Burkholderia sp. Ac-20365]
MTNNITAPTTSADSLRELTETTEQFLRAWVENMQKFPTDTERVESLRDQCRGAIHLRSFLAIHMFHESPEVERAEYDRLRTLVEDAGRATLAMPQG